MIFTLSLVCALFLSVVSTLEANFNHGFKGIQTEKPLIIGHRGASGIYPEHTIKAYQEAINQGADFIECDVIVSKDLEYLCVHDNWLSKVTNVKDVFPGCEETLYVPDFLSDITDCFAHRFTLAQLKTLRVKQSFATRDPQYDLQFEIPTLKEYLDVAKNAGQVVGVYPELKNPNFVHGLDIWSGADVMNYEENFIKILHEAGYTQPDDPCIIQSFDYNSLLHMKNQTMLPCVMLRWIGGPPITDDDLDQYARDGIHCVGSDKRFIIGEEGKPTGIVKKAHARGLKLHAWTFRNDVLDLTYELDIYNEYAKHAEADIDGAFTDFPATYRRALELLYPADGCVNTATKMTNLSSYTLILFWFIVFKCSML